MDTLESHPYVKTLLDTGRWDVTRPYHDVPDHHKDYSLTTGTLIGEKLIHPTPLALSLKQDIIDATGVSELVMVYKLGDKLCGHKGIIHGGLLATLLDESLCRCGFPVLPNKVGVTATLNTQYMAPTPSGSFVVLKAYTTKVEGRKVWVDGATFVLPTADDYDAEKELVQTVKAQLLAIEPKWASKLTERGKDGRPVEKKVENGDAKPEQVEVQA